MNGIKKMNVSIICRKKEKLEICLPFETGVSTDDNFKKCKTQAKP